MIRVYFILYLLSISMAMSGQLAPQTANYTMNIKLDEVNKKLTGQTALVWNNPSNDTIWTLPFHLYYNAFKNNRSTFMKESGGARDFLITDKEECHWGWSEILNITDHNGNDLSNNQRYIHPDDDNEEDRTVVEITLPDPVLPHSSITLEFSWEAKIPKIKPRTGYNKDFYFFAQWYPKIGVYEYSGVRGATQGRWNCHQYHATGEYYSDFGHYDVTLDVPAHYQVASSGSLMSKNQNEDRAQWRFQLADVIDFTWSCSPHFIIQKSKWKDVELIFASYPSHEHLADRYFQSIKESLEYMDQYVGKYPYKTLTMVDPPIHGLFTGGMEYPTLISSISLCFLPVNLRTTETLVVHEFVHQYFMQMIATHEVEDTWMDEGFTTYYENRILDHYYGKKTSLLDVLGFRIGSGEYNRAEFFGMENPKIAPNSTRSYEFKHGGYGPIQYNKTAVWLKTLEGLVGRECFDTGMKRYFETWKYKHPTRDDFTSIMGQTIHECHGDRFGSDMDWYFDQMIDGTEICDYAIASITNRKKSDNDGFFDDNEQCEKSSTDEPTNFQSTVVIHRLGEIQLPIELQVNYADGQSKTIHWDGYDRTFAYESSGAEKIISAEIDPDRKLQLDANFINNSYIIDPKHSGIKQIFFSGLSKVQHFYESINWVI